MTDQSERHNEANSSSEEAGFAHDEEVGVVGELDAVADVVRVHQEQEDDGLEHHLVIKARGSGLKDAT